MIKLNRRHLEAALIMILLVSMTAVTMLTMTNVTSALYQPTYLYVDPSEVRDVAVDSQFWANVSVAGAPPTKAWEFYLSWDPDLLELIPHYDPWWDKTVNVTEGDFLDRRWYWEAMNMWVKNRSTTFGYTPLDEANAAGEITVGCALIGSPELLGSDGRRWMASLRFNVTDTGSSVLELHKTQLELTGGWTYYPNEDGFFSNVDIHDIAVISVTTNTSSVVPGDIVGINVTAENEGDFQEDFNVTVYADVTLYNMTIDWWPDETVIGDEITIGTQNVTNLNDGQNTNLTFTWDTAGLPAEKYYISANVMLMSPGDDDPRDNMYIDSTVTFIVQDDLRVHDVTILTPVVLRGEVANLTVTVLNQGTGTDTVTLYVDANGTNINITSTSLSAGANSTYSISWNTTSFAGGNYNITAYVTPAPNEREVDKADNLGYAFPLRVKIIDMNVNLITVFTPSVYEGWLANFTVTVLNKGTETETVMLYVGANRTLPSNQTILDQFITIPGGASRTYNYSWDTTDIPWGMYNVSAEVPVHPDDEDPNDNVIIDVWIHVMIPGDLTGDTPGSLPDGDVDRYDFGVFGDHYGKTE